MSGNDTARMAQDRKARLEEQERLIKESGRGLLDTQVEVKYAPWRATWERLDLLLERQEHIIALLEKLTGETAEDAGAPAEAGAPGKMADRRGKKAARRKGRKGAAGGAGRTTRSTSPTTPRSTSRSKRTGPGKR